MQREVLPLFRSGTPGAHAYGGEPGVSRENAMIPWTGKSVWISLGAIAALFFLQPTARADSYNVTVDTSSLVGSSSGPFQVLFALEDANTTSGDGNNTASISGFSAGGGSVGTPVAGQVGGGVSGSLSSTLSFTDSDPSGLNYWMASFTPGNTLSFNFSMTGNADSNTSGTGFPGDEFLFFILNNDGSDFVVTTDAMTPDTFFLAVVNGSSGLGVQGFNIPGAAATTVVSSTAAPEPGTLLLLFSGILGLGILGFRARKRSLAPDPAYRRLSLS